MAIVPLFDSFSPVRPRNPSKFNLQLLRDQFSLTTWLLIGGALQSILFVLPIRPSYIVAPTFLILLTKVIDTLLITYNLKANPYLEGTYDTRFAALIPNSDGTFGAPKTEEDKENDSIVILHLGFTVNHPLGIFAPGVREVGEGFKNMAKDLAVNAETNGFLGSTRFLSEQPNRDTKSEIVQVFYFRSNEHVHKWAEEPVHRDVWNWWNKVHTQYRHLGIMHEVYEAPKSKFEAIWNHGRPNGIGATTFPVNTKDGKGWMSPIVNAGRNALGTSKGRMNAYNA